MTSSENRLNNTFRWPGMRILRRFGKGLLAKPKCEGRKPVSDRKAHEKSKRAKGVWATTSAKAPVGNSRGHLCNLAYVDRTRLWCLEEVFRSTELARIPGSRKPGPVCKMCRIRQDSQNAPITKKQVFFRLYPLKPKG